MDSNPDPFIITTTGVFILYHFQFSQLCLLNNNPCFRALLSSRQRQFTACDARPSPVFSQQILGHRSPVRIRFDSTDSTDTVTSTNAVAATSTCTQQHSHILSRELNDFQQEAISQFIECTRELRLLQGPPGTGKTRVVAALLAKLHPSRVRLPSGWMMGFMLGDVKLEDSVQLRQCTGGTARPVCTFEAPFSRTVVCAPSNKAVMSAVEHYVKSFFCKPSPLHDTCGCEPCCSANNLAADVAKGDSLAAAPNIIVTGMSTLLKCHNGSRSCIQPFFAHSFTEYVRQQLDEFLCRLTHLFKQPTKCRSEEMCGKRWANIDVPTLLQVRTAQIRALVQTRAPHFFQSVLKKPWMQLSKKVHSISSHGLNFEYCDVWTEIEGLDSLIRALPLQNGGRETSMGTDEYLVNELLGTANVIFCTLAVVRRV